MPFSLKKYSELVKVTDGGMSQIFRAVDCSTKQVVAIKKMALDQAHRSFSSELIQNEIRNASMLSHKNIISLLDYGEYENDFYIVMEYIDGCNLNSLISDNDFNPEIGLLIVLKALQALHFSHSKGIIHCDIKPSNILIDKCGRVILSDFGLSQAKAYERTFSNVLNDFTTPLFMPPEQADVVAEIVGLKSDEWAETTTIIYKEMSAEQARALLERGKQWDIWAVGVLLYRIISGYYPFFENDFANLLNSIKYSEAPNVGDFVNNLPLSIAKVIEDCLKKDPYQRPQSLEPVIDALQDYFSCRGITNEDEMIAAYMQEKIGVSHVVSSIQESPNAAVDNKPRRLSTDSQNDYQWEYIDFDTISYTPPRKHNKHKADDHLQIPSKEDLKAEPTAAEPTAAEPITEEPITEEPITEEPITEEPITEEPITEEPITEEPITEEPITEEPITEEPITEESITEESITEESITEESITEESITEESITEESITEEPITEEPISEEPISERQSPVGQSQTKRAEQVKSEELNQSEPTIQNGIDFSFRSRFGRSITIAALFICLLVAGFVFIKLQTGKDSKAVEYTVNEKGSQVTDIPKEASPEPDQIPQRSVNSSTELDQATINKPVNNAIISSSAKQPAQSKESQKIKPVRQPVQTSLDQESLVSTSEDSEGLIKVTIDPSEAKVFIDGSLLFQSELISGTKLSAGAHILTAKAAGYIPYERSIVIEQGKTVIFAVVLKPDVKGNGQLHIYSYPWANLYIDDVLVGTAPTQSPILLVEGNHQVVLKREGFQMYNQTVTIKNGETTRLQVQLEKVK